MMTPGAWEAQALIGRSSKASTDSSASPVKGEVGPVWRSFSRRLIASTAHS